MISKHELIRFEAPAVMWRSIGALATAIANITGKRPEQESFEGVTFNTWGETWANDQRHGYSLVVRQDLFGNAGPGVLMMVEPKNPDTGLNAYTHYLFPVNPHKQTKIGFLAVFRGVLDMEGSTTLELNEQQEAQMMAEMDIGTAKGTFEDLGELSGHLWQGVLYVAGPPNK